MKQERLLNLSKPYIYCILIFILLVPSANSLNSFELIFTERGSDTSDYAGHRIAGVGDINGDGLDDVAICFKGRDSTFIYYGNNIKDSIPDQKVYGGFNVAYAHDVTGDGIGDIITSNGKYCLIYRGFGDSLGTQATDTIYPDFRYHIIDTSFGVEIATGMVDGDSIFDIAILTDFTDSTSRLRLVYGGQEFDSAIFDWGYDYPSYSHRLRSLAIADINADEIDDIIIGATGELDSVGQVEIFLGDALVNVPSIIIKPPGLITDPYSRRFFGIITSNIGDINSDGICDLGIVSGSELSLIYFGGVTFDTLYDIATTLNSTVIRGIGDVNRDGYFDFATGSPGYGFGDGRLAVYLGGINVDSLPDAWVFKYDLPADLIQSVGYRVAAAGDFNGDRLCDIMFSAETWSDSWQKGRIYIIAGDTDIITDVVRDDIVAPSDFWIDNYPNPLNTTATIRFFLPYKARIKLSIMDILGRKRRTLCDEILSHGVHSVVWDGRGDNGQSVSTGVYLLQYSADKFKGEIKIIILK